MPYQFGHGETTIDAFHRIVAEEIDDAVSHLKGKSGKEQDESIHEARKSLKKLRGLLRLFRAELGEDVFRAENERLRNVGRILSELRDTVAAIEVFDTLADGYRSELPAETVEAVHNGLENSKREFETANDVEASRKRTARLLSVLRKRLISIRLKRDGLETILPGLKLAYRRGRRAMRRAAEDPKPENFHEWRKRVKDYWYHTKLLEPIWPDAMNSQEKSLKNLQDWLGDDHNLVVLGEKLQENPARFGNAEMVEPVKTVAARHTAKLRHDALQLGRRVYHQRTKKVAKDIAWLWKIWRSELKERSEEPGESAPKKAGKRQGLGSSKTSAA